MIVTAAPDLIPPPLINQLKASGRMVIPVGLPNAQRLVVVDKDVNFKIKTRKLCKYCSRCLRDKTRPRSAHLDYAIELFSIV
jgi:protein-L-isoaspartate O-methyltransferase